MAGGHATIFSAYGKALEGRRKDAMLQVHFGADYTSGEYGWSTKLDVIKRSIDWQLKNLKTDYIDFGFIHCLDEQGDLAAYEKNGALKFILEDEPDERNQGLFWQIKAVRSRLHFRRNP